LVLERFGLTALSGQVLEANPVNSVDHETIIANLNAQSKTFGVGPTAFGPRNGAPVQVQSQATSGGHGRSARI
jgi:hypothetical protein